MLSAIADHSFEFENVVSFSSAVTMDLCPLSRCASTVKSTRRVERMWDEQRPMPNQAAGADEISASLFRRRPAVSRSVMFSYCRLGRCSTRLLDQLVKLTSNACAPREEAKPSVSPARYMTTPFWFVSLACIFPSIRVSPRLMPW